MGQARAVHVLPRRRRQRGVGGFSTEQAIAERNHRSGSPAPSLLRFHSLNASPGKRERKMRRKLWMRISVVAALGALVFAGKHRSQRAPVDREPSREQQPAPTAARAPTSQILAASSPKYPSVAADDEPGVDDIPDFDFESGKTPQIVWEKEEDGWKVSLNEAGMISVIKRVPEKGWDYTPEEVSKLEISKRLHREARQ